MSLSHAGPLNNAQRSSQNKPLPRLLAPPHLSPLSGASPTQATRTKKKIVRQHSPLPSLTAPLLLPLSLIAVLSVVDVHRKAVNWSHVTSRLLVFVIFSRLPSSPPSVCPQSDSLFFEIYRHTLHPRHLECCGYLAKGSRPVRLIRDVDGRRRLIRLLLSVM